MEPAYPAPLTVREVVIALLEKEIEVEAGEDTLRESGVDIDGIPRIYGLSVALDLLGIPPDNTVEMWRKYGDPNVTRVVPYGTFCRDGYYFMWDEIVEPGTGDQDVEGYIERVLEDFAAYEREVEAVQTSAPEEA